MSYRRKHIKPQIRKLKPKRRLVTRPVFWILLCLAIVICAGFYFFLFFPGLQISNIEVSGNQNIKTEDIKNAVLQNIDRKILPTGFLNISSKSFFIVNTKAAIDDILKNHPLIEKIDLQKKFPRTIVVKIKERQPFAALCPKDSETDCYLIDESGVIFDRVHYATGFIVRRNDMLAQNIGDAAVGKNVLVIILKFQKELINNFQVEISEAFLTDDQKLDLKTSEGWHIYFNSESGSDIQLLKLDALLKDKFTADQRQKLSYIDLRFKDRAYYK